MRELTGNWYLRKRFLGGYAIMVEVIITTTCHHTLSEHESEPLYEKARTEDLIKLNIIRIHNV